MNNNFIEIAKLIMVASWLLFMAIIDIQKARIPDKYMKWFLYMSFGFILYNLQSPLSVVISFGITLFFMQVIYHTPQWLGITKTKGSGGRDVWILAIISLLYPIPLHGFPIALLIFGVAGVGVGLYGMITAEQNETIDGIKNRRIPFIPFLLLGYFILIITSF